MMIKLKPITLRKYQEKASRRLINFLRRTLEGLQEEKNTESEEETHTTGPQFCALEGTTGSGKTITTLMSLKAVLGNLGAENPVIDREQVFVFVRTKSQMQAYLRDCRLLGIRALGIPSKSDSCYNDEVGNVDDKTEIVDILNQIQVAGAPGANTEIEEVKEVVSSNKEIAALTKVLNTVNGKCSRCLLNPGYIASQLNPDNGSGMPTLLNTYHKLRPREKDEIILAKFLDLLYKYKDLDSARERFEELYPYICPFSLCLSVWGYFDVIVMTYPYLLTHSIRNFFLNPRSGGGSNVVILDEAHHLDEVKNNTEFDISQESLERLIKYLVNTTTGLGNKGLGKLFTDLIHLLDTVNTGFTDLLLEENSETFSAFGPEHLSVLIRNKTPVEILISCFQLSSALEAELDKMVKRYEDLSPSDRKIFIHGRKGLATLKSIQELFRTVILRYPSVIESWNLTEGEIAELGLTCNKAEKDSDFYCNPKKSLNNKAPYGSYFDIENKTIQVRCLALHLEVKKVFSRCRSVIFLSGTIPSENYFKTIYGIDVEIVSMKPNMGQMEIFSVSGVSSLYDQRNSETFRKFASIIEEIHNLHPKHTFSVFTSGSMLKSISEYLNPDCTWVETGKSVSDLVKAMDVAKNPEVFCIVSGSRLSEGVEYLDHKGDSHIGKVVICGIPIVPPSLVHDDWGKYLQNKFLVEEWNIRILLYLEPAYNKIRQAIGRAIRGPDDKVAVYLCDNRFSEQKFWQRQFSTAKAIEWE